MNTSEDLLTYSQKMYEQKDSYGEIGLRNVARTAYYALYHKLNGIELDDIPTSNRNYGSHEMLIQKLRSSDDLEFREFGLLLASLKSVRTKADYKLNQRFSESDAYSTLRKVEKMFKSSSIVQDGTDDTESVQKQKPEDIYTSENINRKPKLSVVKRK